MGGGKQGQRGGLNTGEERFSQRRKDAQDPGEKRAERSGRRKETKSADTREVTRVRPCENRAALRTRPAGRETGPAQAFFQVVNRLMVLVDLFLLIVDFLGQGIHLAAAPGASVALILVA
jgi:hypothetical protein